MVQVASATITYAEEVTPELKEYVALILEEFKRTRLKSYYNVGFWRTPDESGKINHKNTGNKLHRAAGHMGYYFTCPVLINYDNFLSPLELYTAISELRYSDVGRYYLVELNKDGTYTVDLYQNLNITYDCIHNVKLLDPKEKANV